MFQQLILELGVTGGDASKVGYYVGFIVCELAPFIRCTSDLLHFISRNPSFLSRKLLVSCTGDAFQTPSAGNPS